MRKAVVSRRPELFVFFPSDFHFTDSTEIKIVIFFLSVKNPKSEKKQKRSVLGRLQI